jgi:hypothetical protein
MNCIFIYLFFEVGGAELLYRVFTPFTTSLLGWTGEISAGIVNSILGWAAQWYICFWLYKNKLFIKI